MLDAVTVGRRRDQRFRRRETTWGPAPSVSCASGRTAITWSWARCGFTRCARPSAA